ncbi:glycosyltransferase [Aestuariirhabdus haliotis]|uniref:glycosyltransferase n=1 Tax=Aestuariirhabdus haliotis TaxID=2918751 RepID=UPI0020C04899|nr:hypothetical protein [Aestuariirhabdus haliotis]MCL6419721.1 hypothetical protein [Aestuariirhabdus haliotis]
MRIFHGLTNIAGIGGYLAAYQQEQGFDSKLYVLTPNKFYDNHDLVVCERIGKIRCGRHIAKIFFFFWSFWRFDVYNFYFGETLLPFSVDLPILRLLKKKVVMIYCGSDVRLTEIERSRNEFWDLVAPQFVGMMDDPCRDPYKKIMMRWQGFWCNKVIAPRNLYAPVSLMISNDKIVSDLWVHNLGFTDAVDTAEVVDLNDERKNLRVVHLPTSPLLKGTSYFRQAVDELKNEGLVFDYVEVTGVEHAEALKQVFRADIILDQILMGGFGSLSIEGMSFGKPVVCYLLESVKDKHCPDCPVVSATILTVKGKLKELLLSKDLRLQLGVEGKAFVNKYLDSKLINERVLDLYKDLYRA